MFGRERRFGRNRPTGDAGYREGGVATAQDEPVAGDALTGNAPAETETRAMNTTAAPGNGSATDAPPAGPARTPQRHGTARAAADAVVIDHEARKRQHERFGGFNWGAAFFGWLVAIGMGAILTAIVVAAGTAIGLTNGTPSTSDAAKNADTIGIAGGILLLVIAMLAYYAGGYVAGRMSRFDGARQGFGVWLFGLLLTIAVAAAGAIFGDQYNVFEQLNLPRIPLSPSDLTTGGIIALVAILVGSLVAALAGGKVGQRYHRRVDRAALAEPV